MRAEGDMSGLGQLGDPDSGRTGRTPAIVTSKRRGLKSMPRPATTRHWRDMSGICLFYELAQGRLTPGTRAELIGLKLEFQTLLAELPSPEAIARLEAPPAQGSIWEQVGDETVTMLRNLREQLAFLGDSVQGPQETVTGWNRALSDIMVESQTDLRASLVASSLLSSDSDLVTGPSRRSARE